MFFLGTVFFVFYNATFVYKYIRARDFRSLESTAWRMKKSMGFIQGPNGEFDRPYSDGVNSKRIRSNLWPKGKFNEGGEGPHLTR